MIMRLWYMLPIFFSSLSGITWDQLFWPFLTCVSQGMVCIEIVIETCRYIAQIQDLPLVLPRWCGIASLDLAIWRIMSRTRVLPATNTGKTLEIMTHNQTAARWINTTAAVMPENEVAKSESAFEDVRKFPCATLLRSGELDAFLWSNCTTKQTTTLKISKFWILKLGNLATSSNENQRNHGNYDAQYTARQRNLTTRLGYCENRSCKLRDRISRCCEILSAESHSLPYAQQSSRRIHPKLTQFHAQAFGQNLSFTLYLLDQLPP